MLRIYCAVIKNEDGSREIDFTSFSYTEEEAKKKDPNAQRIITFELSEDDRNVFDPQIEGFRSRTPEQAYEALKGYLLEQRKKPPGFNIFKEMFLEARKLAKEFDEFEGSTTEFYEKHGATKSGQILIKTFPTPWPDRIYGVADIHYIFEIGWEGNPIPFIKDTRPSGYAVSRYVNENHRWSIIVW